MRRGLVSLLVVFTALSVGHATDPPRTKFDNLPADVEVHVVAVYEPRFSGVVPAEITDPLGLVKELRAKDGPGAHIRKLLPQETDEVLTAEVEMGKIGDLSPALVKRRVTIRLAMSFTNAIPDHVFYDEGAFAKVELTESAKKLVALGDKRTVFQTARLNRELLSIVFPKCIAPPPDDFQTVRVTVKAGKPVVLVFSSSNQAQWAVTVEKGATVAGVIHFGNFAQGLSGTDAPVVYLAGLLPNGQQSGHFPFNCHEKGGEYYDRMVGIVKELTGKGFTTFQGQYHSGKEPFVVTPGAK